MTQSVAVWLLTWGALLGSCAPATPASHLSQGRASEVGESSGEKAPPIPEVLSEILQKAELARTARLQRSKSESITKVRPRENRVPSFQLVDLAGAELNSKELVGREAFAVVFFASWCELCAKKMPAIRRAAEKVSVRLLLVSVDDADTWSHVPGFLREQHLGNEQVINGLEFPEFSRRYNPVSSIPLVVVVGKDGDLVDYQIGLHDGDGERLEASLRRARRP